MNKVFLLLLMLIADKALADPLSEAAIDQQPLSPYMQWKVERLLKEKMSCLGCHRFGSEGGRIAPDLLSVKNRLSADYVRRMIDNPQETVPGTVMPKTRMTAGRLQLLTAFLMRHNLSASAATDATNVQQSKSPASEAGSGAALFAKYCSACHGSYGRGDGVNAPFLSPPPTDLSNPQRMSLRPDDTLFDGISAGGRVLDINHRMPAWGQTLTAAEIRLLVQHIRTLCKCQGPEWSRHGV